MTEFNAFPNAHDFVMNNPQIIHISQAERRGLDILLEASIPAAAYDSPEHPCPCHPGTRVRYVDLIAGWCLNDADREHRIFWLKGPAGVGKSAIAQSCAENFAVQGKLVAAFFFSRPNQREDPQRLFTSISYQWASKRKSYGEILRSTIHDDPTIVNKELPHQFQHLFVSPLQELNAKGENVTERVVIVDGLDECIGEAAQRAIIKIVVASIRDDTTPFIWMFCSRLEPHLIATFSSPEVSAVTHQEKLMVSRDTDDEIAKYLSDELTKIGEEHGLMLPWPRGQDIDILVNLSGGLFIYASTVVRFIGDRNSLGPEDQLQAVLALATNLTTHDPEHPLSELDFVYILILQRIPTKILQTIQWILLATTIFPVGKGVTQIKCIRQVLDLSTSQFNAACRTLHSVMKIQIHQVAFYHASFMEFMQDPRRSKQFCIRSEPAFALRTNLVQRLRASCDDLHLDRSSSKYTGAHGGPDNSLDAYNNVIIGSFALCSTLPLDDATLTALASFNFKNMAVLWTRSLVLLPIDALFLQMSQIPENLSRKIIRSCKDSDRDIVYAREVTQKPSWADWDKSYIFGHGGQRKCFCWRHVDNGTFYFQPYPERPVGDDTLSISPILICFCVLSLIIASSVWVRPTSFDWCIVRHVIKEKFL